MPVFGCSSIGSLSCFRMANPDQELRCACGNPVVTSPALHAIALEFIGRHTPVRFLSFLSPAPHLLGTMQVFLISAPQKMPALRGHFCFCLTVLLAAQATFSPPLRLSAWFGAFHFRFHRFQDNGCLAFGFRPVLSGCLANFFKIVFSPVRDIFQTARLSITIFSC